MPNQSRVQKNYMKNSAVWFAQFYQMIPLFARNVIRLFYAEFANYNGKEKEMDNLNVLAADL